MTIPQPPSILRQSSLRSVLEAALRHGPISRAELARITGLSKQTTSEVVRVLEERGWLRVTGQTQGAVGRSATTYEVEANTALVLGIDLGGTKTHVALANLTGEIVGEAIQPTDTRGGRFVIDQIGGLLDRVAEESAVSPGAKNSRSAARRTRSRPGRDTAPSPARRGVSAPGAAPG